MTFGIKKVYKIKNCPKAKMTFNIEKHTKKYYFV